MDSIWIIGITAIVTIFSSGTVAYLLKVFFERRRNAADISKITAETKKIDSEDQRTETIYYRERLEETIAKLRSVDIEVKELKLIIETAQIEYEQRVGTLHVKMDGLVTALDRANAALDTANETIAQLRQEVKDGNLIISEGNLIITELRKEISHLLIKQAKSEST